MENFIVGKNRMKKKVNIKTTPRRVKIYKCSTKGIEHETVIYERSFLRFLVIILINGLGQQVLLHYPSDRNSFLFVLFTLVNITLEHHFIISRGTKRD